MASQINYPDSFDTDLNLFLVHDSLRVRLLEDYNLGDTFIVIDGDNSIFPSTGQITLTEQCSDPSVRAITFSYSSKTSTTFEGLELLDGFTDTVKPKFQTTVTMNVMADHHNAIKDALIAIQEFVGVKGTTDTKPLGSTMEGRINFLRKLVLHPRAWFSVDKRVGIIPLTVTFTDMSFRDPTSYVWDFGDGGVSTVSVISNTISSTSTTVQHTYYTPGYYDVTLSIFNEFGSDTVILPKVVNARTKAPDYAVISVGESAFQEIKDIDENEEAFLYTHLVPGLLKTRINTLVSLAIQDKGEQPGDEIVSYEWKLGDDLNHVSADTTTASYSIGGIYDIKIRLDTEFGAYRTTILRGAIEVVENQNLFLGVFDSGGSGVTQNLSSYEFGQVSETFKTNNRSSLPVTRNYNFFDVNATNYAQKKREFLRNNGFTNRTNISSGYNGTALMYWSEGAGSGSPLSSQTVRLMEYEGFKDVWRTPTSFTFARPWNWVGLNSPSSIYLLFGSNTAGDTSANTTKTQIEFVGLDKTETTLTTNNFKNSGEELLTQVGGENFSVYRSAWNGANGYILRNDGINTFFRIKSFYKTEGTTADPISYIRKLTDMPGSAKLEGKLVTLTQGLYFFNNSGEIAVYSPVTNTWVVGGPGVNSPTFRSLQDGSVSGFDNVANTLLVTSDNDRRAYLSYDYSANVFLRFNEADLTFSSLVNRPEGEQFVSGVF